MYSSLINILQLPDRISVVTAEGATFLTSDRPGHWCHAGLEITTQVTATYLTLSLRAPDAAVKWIRLYWQGDLSGAQKVLGDHWERGYGDLAWQAPDATRILPWYFLIFDGQCTNGYGVMVAPHAFCYWQAEAQGITLHADVRNGGEGVRLGQRTLEVCQIVRRPGQAGESPFAAARAFCRQMCPATRRTAQPVYGFNDWYYAYGNNTAENILQDAALLSELTADLDNRPFCVVDAGWQLLGGCDRGPWNQSNACFPDMGVLATQMKALQVRPGIWIRPLGAAPQQPAAWRLSRDPNFFDPTNPEVLQQIAVDITQLRAWGYELIKHDFTTFDLTGRWGFQMGAEVTPDGWSFQRRDQTTAEIILELYRTIRAAAGDVVMIGCNTISHLAAGIFEVNRIGDDTSGRAWPRTREMGVNSLAFRAAQHAIFYAVDADCAPITSQIRWDLNRQWLDLVARSGTPLFVSAERQAVGVEQKQALQAALHQAAIPQPLATPLDWLENPLPCQWQIQNEVMHYDWYLRPVLPPLPPKPPLPEIDLASLEPRQVTVGWGQFTPNQTVMGTPLRIGEKIFTEGIGLHAVGQAIYPRLPQYQRFVALAGLEESQRLEGTASVICKILAYSDIGSPEPQLLATSPVLRFDEVEYWYFDVPLPVTCQFIELRVEAAGDGIACDHVNWVTAGFLK